MAETRSACTPDVAIIGAAPAGLMLAKAQESRLANAADLAVDGALLAT